MAAIFMVSHTDRFGTASYGFSTEAKANDFALRFARERWTRTHSDEPMPDDEREFWEMWDELEPDERIDFDNIVVDQYEETLP